MLMSSVARARHDVLRVPMMSTSDLGRVSIVPAAFEELIAFIAAQLSRPVTQHDENNTLVFTGGDPPEVIVRLTPLAVVVAEYSLEWQGPHTAIVVPITI